MKKKKFNIYRKKCMLLNINVISVIYLSLFFYEMASYAIY